MSHLLGGREVKLLPCCCMCLSVNPDDLTFYGILQLEGWGGWRAYVCIWMVLGLYNAFNNDKELISQHMCMCIYTYLGQLVYVHAHSVILHECQQTNQRHFCVQECVHDVHFLHVFYK